MELYLKSLIRNNSRPINSWRTASDVSFVLNNRGNTDFKKVSTGDEDLENLKGFPEQAMAVD